MSKLSVVMFPNEILQESCEKVSVFNKELRKLLKDMHTTMVEADGVGLAAPQVGIRKQIAIVENDEGKIIQLINPIVIEQSGSQIDTEGCLSFPGLFGEVQRATHIKVKAQDKLGRPFFLEAEGFFARVILHEIDHLHGILFPSKALTLYKEKNLQ